MHFEVNWFTSYCIFGLDFLLSFWSVSGDRCWLCGCNLRSLLCAIAVSQCESCTILVESAGVPCEGLFSSRYLGFFLVLQACLIAEETYEQWVNAVPVDL